jgi:hypothetical protein
MKTPAFRPFINSVGKTVHHLNTIAVGLSGVEAKACAKPEELDVSWEPKDLLASSRDARRFTLKSTIVFVSEELVEYNKKIIYSPNIGDVSLPKKPTQADKHVSLCEYLKLDESLLVLGPLLLIHWRNKIIHKSSNATLTNNQIKELIKADAIAKKNYKELCVERLMNDFKKNLPTLKDVSSLISMTINYVHAVEEIIPEPQSKEDFELWLKRIDLYTDYERIVRVALHQKNPETTINNFLITHCPELIESYNRYCRSNHS